MKLADALETIEDEIRCPGPSNPRDREFALEAVKVVREDLEKIQWELYQLKQKEADNDESSR